MGLARKSPCAGLVKPYSWAMGALQNVDDTNHVLEVVIMPDINPSISKNDWTIPSQTEPDHNHRSTSNNTTKSSTNCFLDCYEAFMGAEKIDRLSWQTQNFHFQTFDHPNTSEGSKN